MTVRVAGHNVIASGSVIVFGGATVEFVHEDNGHEFVQRVRFTTNAHKPSNTVDAEVLDEYH